MLGMSVLRTMVFFCRGLGVGIVCFRGKGFTQGFEGGGAFKDGVRDVGLFEECTQHEAS